MFISLFTAERDKPLCVGILRRKCSNELVETLIAKIDRQLRVAGKCHDGRTHDVSNQLIASRLVIARRSIIYTLLPVTT